MNNNFVKNPKNKVLCLFLAFLIVTSSFSVNALPKFLNNCFPNSKLHINKKNAIMHEEAADKLQALLEVSMGRPTRLSNFQEDDVKRFTFDIIDTVGGWLVTVGFHSHNIDPQYYQRGGNTLAGPPPTQAGSQPNENSSHSGRYGRRGREIGLGLSG